MRNMTQNTTLEAIQAAIDSLEAAKKRLRSLGERDFSLGDRAINPTLKQLRAARALLTKEQ